MDRAAAMATVREKAAALSLSAACSPAARPPGTGRGAGCGRGGKEGVRWLSGNVAEGGLKRGERAGRR